MQAVCAIAAWRELADIDYQAGKLRDRDYSAEEVAMALAGLPVV